MMSYDFDQVIDRKNTQSTKWENNKVLFGTDDVLDMWVADTEFPSPQPVLDALKQRLEHPIFGYTFPAPSLYDAIVERLDRHFGWRVKREWIVFTAGVVNALYSSVQAFSHPGDEVIVQPPVYYPFYSAVKDSGRQVLHNPLAFDGERHTMDFAQLQSLFQPITRFPARSPRAKMLILCNPHNPVGRVWTRDELAQMAEICVKNNCLILSDEIHCDLLVRGARHTVTSTLSEEIAQQTITYMSASKTFNLAGLATSFVVIPNDRLRQVFTDARRGNNSGNLLGWIALEAAYRHGDDYVKQLQDYLNGNLEFFMDYIQTRIPQIKVIKPEGTYLVWVDMRRLGMNHLELQRFMHEEACLALDDGYAFGPGGEGFQRFNLACPRSMVVEAVHRLEKAIKGL